ncbi:hypothetical protein DPMN_118317 [Dreissena polymorpha]|uniref:Uncharacterized protein n=1 Tax=Dreissena polymorpha TaxID=45954 RepID=A0A9D4GJY5_DREPO|nr:hypothetical protein DPMN_118317 [Dreissena polymorpha]
MERSLLETGVQLMALLTISFLTMKAIPWRCIESSQRNHILYPSSVDVSPKHRHLISSVASQHVRQFMHLVTCIGCYYVTCSVGCSLCRQFDRLISSRRTVTEKCDTNRYPLHTLQS